MSALALGAAIAVVLGGSVAVGARDPRLALLGLLAALVAAPFVAGSPADPLAVSARVVGAVLAAYLLWIVVRAGTTFSLPASPGIAAELLAALAAVAIGSQASLVAPPAGPLAAQAVGFGLLVLAIGPLLLGRDALRLGFGAMLFVAGASLVSAAWAGVPGPAIELATAGIVVGLAGGTAAIAGAATRGNASGRARVDELGEALPDSEAPSSEVAGDVAIGPTARPELQAVPDAGHA